MIISIYPKRDKWMYLNKNLAYPYEYFMIIDDYQKPVNDFEKEKFFNKSEIIIQVM